MKNRIIVPAAAFLMAACGSHAEPLPDAAPAEAPAGAILEISAVPRTVYTQVHGSARPIREATLSTRLMGSVTAVEANVGDMVRRGTPLVRIDSRDLAARGAQIEASIAAADAAQRQAQQQALRMRALFAEDAAPRAQLDAAEADLERAVAGANAARASAHELGALSSYSVIEAPFSGLVQSRFIDPGSFAAPGSPLMAIQDLSQLRISASAAPGQAAGLRRGDVVSATIEGRSVQATVEGIAPSAGSMFTINAIVDNAALALMPGSASLFLPAAERPTIVIPQHAVVQRADLTGVWLSRDGQSLLRWVRVGPAAADSVEVLSGLEPGDRIIVPVQAR